ncbi:MAG: hypothetical protein EOP49_46400, partial [Sphingobacteriales bacterium]
AATFVTILNLTHMKRSLLTMLAFIIAACATGQNDYRKLPSIGVQFLFQDFQGAEDLRSKSLLQVIRDNEIYKTRRMSPGIGFSYLEGVSNHIDLNVNLAGSFTRYPVPEKPLPASDKLLLEAAFTANIKLLSDRHFFTPFLIGGIGASKYGPYYAAFMPVGLGLQFKLARDFFFQTNSQYRIPVTGSAEYHLMHSFGIVAPLKDRKPAEPVVIPVVILDRDNDGVLDSVDRCPDTAGLANLMGCPDRDGDGIADDQDKCPDQAGTAKYEGCPIPDGDGDGVNDEEDKCPTVAGLARYQGCPIPDGDGDGVNDEEDKCPTRPGPASNSGCPEIAKAVIEKVAFAAKNVFFSTGSYKLLPKSYKSLDEVAKLMKEDETLMIDIDGHTD